jgi:GMP synthase-like glutamine amidotransferase
MSALNKSKRRVLVIQARLNPEVITTEQESIRKIANEAGFNPFFINPLNKTDDINWHNPDKLFNGYNCSIWLGSAEIDLTIKTSHRELYRNKILPLVNKIFKENIHTLGICLGHQTFASIAGAKIIRDTTKREFGTDTLYLNKIGENDQIFKSFPSEIPMVFAHNDSVMTLPQGFTVLGSTKRNQFSALRRGNIVTLQSHPEITDTSGLKKRIISAQNNSSNQMYDFTSPLVNPGKTEVIIKNFLKTSLK